MRITLKRTCQSIIIVLLLLFPWAGSLAANEVSVPPGLKDWQDWVLHNRTAELCPISYNSGDQSWCSWPGRLILNVEAAVGHFEQSWSIFSETWVVLPGDLENWPENVRVDGSSAAVINRQGAPCLYLGTGDHDVSGVFHWGELPELMHIPASTGLIELLIENKNVASPVIDKTGRLWLQQRTGAENMDDRLELKLYRLVDDTIPMVVTTHLQLHVSGKAREIRLDNVVLEGSQPVSVSSPLPLMIGPQATFQVQVRPGRWEIEIVTRFEGPVPQIGPVLCPHGQEIWAFQAQHHLRMVNLTGVSAIDPGQTDIPDAWKSYPTYVVQKGETVVFEEQRRGDPDPAPDRISLERTWWLDFNGSSYTVQDRITGTLSRQWYLTMNPAAKLGRVSVDGVDQLITVQGKDRKPGIELRRGSLDIVADSRLETKSRRLKAVDWEHTVQSLSGTMHLPPGWRLLTVSGVDAVPGTWFARWSLLDFFVVLIVALSVVTLRDVKWGLIALLTLILMYHEPGAPKLVWLHILAVLALLRVLPEGKFKKMVLLWGAGAAVFLLVTSVPFMIGQIRTGIYPQLDLDHGPRSTVPAEGRIMDEFAMDKKVARSRYPSSPVQKLEDSVGEQQMTYYSKQRAVLTQDPNALVQTGPGLPNWSWNSFSLRWNGPVDKEQQIRLWLLSPRANLVLAFIRVLLLSLLMYGLVDVRNWWSLCGSSIRKQAALVLFFILSAQGLQASTTVAYPPPELLKELSDRLLQRPDCLPDCANIPRLELTVEQNTIRLILEIHAAIDAAVPLPGSSESWLPDKVLLDQKEIKGLARDENGHLWTLVPRGVHSVILLGNLSNKNAVHIPFILKPHRALYTVKDWEITGIHENGRVESNIQLTRVERKGEKSGLLSSGITPFLVVKRVLHLGLTWQVETSITRLTPPDVPVVLTLPLLEGESVVTDGLQVQGNSLLVNIPSRTTEIQFLSNLPLGPSVQLHAPQGVPWVEQWTVDASPVWHCEFEGIPVIHHQDQEGHWRPEWQPWPGESVTMTISRPEALPGQVVTIDEAQLKWVPGLRFNNAVLSLDIRTSRGGQHVVTLPDKADLQNVRIDGKSQPIRLENNKLVLPLRPGVQQIAVDWNEKNSGALILRAPHIDIGSEAVNARVNIPMPHNRWILWTWGPRLGPAVLFWSFLVVIILAAMCLGKVSMTPLKTRHWLLLGLGLTQIQPLLGLIIVGWFLALGWRKKSNPPDSGFIFNTTQFVLVVWTCFALGGLYLAIERGLLGHPDMQIAGNNSSAYNLLWFQDRMDGAMPRPAVLSLPMWVYRFMMLLWALWLAYSLLQWLKWAWQSFSTGGIWRKRVKKPKIITPKPQPKPSPKDPGHLPTQPEAPGP